MNDALILIIEDEAHIAEGLKQNLLGEGYRVRVVGHGPTGLEVMLAESPALVVLDVMLPEMDGFTLCKQARAFGSTASILFLSARATPEERVLGLKLGGDDYLGKPFHLAEFLGRVEALLRRRQALSPKLEARMWRVEAARGGVCMASHKWCADGRRPESLAHYELQVFRALWEANGGLVSRDDLLEAGWGHDVLPSSRTLEACILRWRERLELDVESPRLLVTERGLGYRLRRE